MNDIKILGLHDEFTVYSAVAIGNLSTDVENDLWDLAQKVDGWGKIQVVDRLASFDLKEHIRDWLVLEGYKNSIMYEYLAFTCATYGELHKKLEAGRIDQNLFKSASDIIKALIAEFSPSEGISTYTFAAQVLQDFLRHSKTHAADIADFNALHEIKNYLEDLQGDIGDQKENGWNQNIISNCLIDLVEILNSRDWKVVAYDGLTSDDKRMFWEAKLAADKLGIDLWESVWEKLRADPTDSTYWSDVTNYSRPEHSDQIITFALTNLPFDELATGPRDGHGFGADFHKHESLEYMTSFLEFYPKKGEKIILTALKSPVTRIRNIAIRVLDQWKRENWSAEIEKEVRHLSEIEPNQESKVDVIRLLNGEALSWEMDD